MTFPVTSLYAALIALLFIALSVRVVRYRRAKQLSMGDHGDNSLLKRTRAHANCAEYAPLSLILLGLAEAQGTPVLALHILGLMMLIGRLAHAYGFSASPPIMNLRVLGMILTYLMIALTALGLLGHAIF